MAACGGCAAAEGRTHRLFGSRFPGKSREPSRGISGRPSRSRLGRRQKHVHRVPLGRGQLGSAACFSRGTVHPRLEKMAGHALEIPTVKRALREVDVVTQSLGVPARSEIILKPTQFFSKATQVLVTAMEEAKVQA